MEPDGRTHRDQMVSSVVASGVAREVVIGDRAQPVGVNRAPAPDQESALWTILDHRIPSKVEVRYGGDLP